MIGRASHTFFTLRRSGGENTALPNVGPRCWKSRLRAHVSPRTCLRNCFIWPSGRCHDMVRGRLVRLITKLEPNVTNCPRNRKIHHNPIERCFPKLIWKFWKRNLNFRNFKIYKNAWWPHFKIRWLKSNFNWFDKLCLRQSTWFGEGWFELFTYFFDWLICQISSPPPTTCPFVMACRHTGSFW